MIYANHRLEFEKRSQLFIGAHERKRFPSSRCASAIQIVRPFGIRQENAPWFLFQVLHGLRVANSGDRIISIISLSLCRPEPVTSSTTPSQYASSGVS